MSQLAFHIKYNKNSTNIISPNDIRMNYLFGINLQRQGISITDDVLQFYINAAVEQLQNYLNIKLQKQIISETKDFIRDDYMQWGGIRTTYPCVVPFNLTGFLGTVQQVVYPTSWLSVKQTSDGELYQRSMYVIPNTNSNATQQALLVYTGLLPTIGYTAKQIPNYWTITYLTGFNKIPPDITNALGMISSMNILLMVQDAFYTYPGQSSENVSLDGLSQNTTLNPQGVFTNRIKGYQNLLFGDGKTQGILASLRDRYSSILFASC